MLSTHSLRRQERTELVAHAWWAACCCWHSTWCTRLRRSAVITQVLLEVLWQKFRFKSQYHNSCGLVWRSGSTLVSINEVNVCCARLVLGWVTVSEFNSWGGTFISVCNQPPRSTQPGHPFVGRRTEYQPKGGDALWLGCKRWYG